MERRKKKKQGEKRPHKRFLADVTDHLKKLQTRYLFFFFNLHVYLKWLHSTRGTAPRGVFAHIGWLASLADSLTPMAALGPQHCLRSKGSARPWEAGGGASRSGRQDGCAVLFYAGVPLSEFPKPIQTTKCQMLVFMASLQSSAH